MSYNAFKTVMEIDAHGTFNVTKAVFDASMQQHGGSVLNISATLHYKGDLLQAHAGAAKAAIGTRCLGRLFATTSGTRGPFASPPPRNVPYVARRPYAAPCKRLGRAWHSCQLRCAGAYRRH